MKKHSHTAANAWPLTATAAAALSVANVQAMTASQGATLSDAALNALSAPAFTALTAVQVKTLAASALAGLTSMQAAHLTATELSALTTNQTQALRATQLNALSRDALRAINAANLTPTQIAGLSATTISSLSASQVARFSLADIGAMSGAQVAALSASAFGALSDARLAAVFSADAGSISGADLAALSPTALASLTTRALALLTTTQAGALSAADLNALSAAQMKALHLTKLSASVAKELSANAVAAMSAAEFAAALGDDIALLTTAAVRGVTVAEIAALSTAQIRAFTPAQAAALSPAATAALASAQLNASGDNPVIADFRSQVKSGSVGYGGLLKVLQDAAAGGLTAGEFAALNQIASRLDAAGGVTTSPYARQIFNDVVKGNSANATWTGGTARPVALGALSAASTQAQATELIGKWFLGADLPSFQAEAGSYASGYQTYSLPLFSSGGPQYADINQGDLGDCYFMAALATEAQQNPLLIQNMIQSVGAGVYSVRFQVNGEADYVTVNSQLVGLDPHQGYNPSGGAQIFANNASNLWAPLLEKAYAELMSQSGIVTYAGVGDIDSYSALNGGDSNGLQAITGQQVVEDYIDAGTSLATARDYLNAVQSAFNAHEGVMLGTSNNAQSPNDNWVAGHMFAVTGVNAAAGTLDLFNPWGTAAAHPGFETQFTATISDMQKMGVTLEYAVGAPLRA